MSFDKGLVSKRENFTFHRMPRRAEKIIPEHIRRGESLKRSSSKPQILIIKKIMKIEKPKLRRKAKLLRKQRSIIERPEAPLNTTQFIIDANHGFEDINNFYLDQERSMYSSQDHPMSGSMMNFMQSKFPNMYEQHAEGPTFGEETAYEGNIMHVDDEEPTETLGFQGYSNMNVEGPWKVEDMEAKNHQLETPRSKILMVFT
jgi:hypothetical protein